MAPEGVLRPAPAAASLRGRSYLALLLLLPGGLLILAGIAVASVGVGLCWPGLRRMTAALGGPDAMRVAPEQPHGASADSGPRVWAGQGGTC